MRLDSLFSERKFGSMPSPWFHERAPDEGTGYSIASREGLLAGIAVIIAVALAVIIPASLGAGVWVVYGIAMAVLLVSLTILRLLVRAHTDS